MLLACHAAVLRSSPIRLLPRLPAPSFFAVHGLLHKRNNHILHHQHPVYVLPVRSVHQLRQRSLQLLRAVHVLPANQQHQLLQHVLHWLLIKHSVLHHLLLGIAVRALNLLQLRSIIAALWLLCQRLLRRLLLLLWNLFL